jgi:acetyl-CoA/propionyl-CoA carboxylase biotin carboxyl carrier protein
VAQPIPDLVFAAFALGRLLGRADDRTGPWERVDGWRPSGAAATTWHLTVGAGSAVTVQVTGGPTGADVQINGAAAIRCHAVSDGDGFLLTVGERTVSVLIAESGERAWLHVDGGTYALTEAPPDRAKADEHDHDGELNSPMPGSVVAVAVVVGAPVREGDVVVVVEAMKMEHSLTAPFDGEIGEVTVRIGDRVAVGQHLATVRRTT